MTGKALVRASRKVPARVIGLRALRRARGLTLAEVAKMAGYRTKTTVQRLETRPPHTWMHLLRIADVLGCSTDEVLGRTAPVPVVKLAVPMNVVPLIVPMTESAPV